MTALPDAEGTARPPAHFDRSADERTDAGLVDAVRRDPGTRVLVVRGDAARISGGPAPRLQWTSADAAPEGASWAFLGRDADGAALLLARVRDRERPDDTWMSLRAIGGALSAREAEIFTTAVGLGQWLDDFGFCPRCGHTAELRTAGWSRVCTACGAEHFPRTDPAVIVAVSSADRPDRLLLGSNAMWGADRFSCFAGFVEAGESAEGAVQRELLEEAGVRLEDVRYRRSQAWPYPRSLMLGFSARAVDDAQARPDGEEIAAVRWFTRSQIGDALQENGAGGLLLPGRSSIARELIEQWHRESA